MIGIAGAYMLGMIPTVNTVDDTFNRLKKVTREELDQRINEIPRIGTAFSSSTSSGPAHTTFTEIDFNLLICKTIKDAGWTLEEFYEDRYYRYYQQRIDEIIQNCNNDLNNVFRAPPFSTIFPNAKIIPARVEYE